jgi:ketosteroid isomerase-like protein
MKRGCLSLLIPSVLALGGAYAAFAQTAAHSSVETEVLAAVAARDRAFLAADEKTVAQFMADDYLQTDVLGHVQDKSTWLKEYFEPLASKIKSGEFRWGTFTKSDVQLRDLGNVAVVIGTLTLRGIGLKWSDNRWVASQQDENRPPSSARFTQVWAKRDGAWKLVVVHNAYTKAESFPVVEAKSKTGPE